MTETTFDLKTLEPRQLSLIFQSAIAPRPVAWVSTISAAGVRNVAAFSYFNAVSTNPPLIMFSISPYRDGRTKDTLANVREVPECVVHVAGGPQIGQVEVTGTEYPPEVDEFDVARLTPIPAQSVRPARILEAAVAMECAVLEVHPLPVGKSNMVICQVKLIHVRSDLLDADGAINYLRLDPIMRLARKDYGLLGKVEDGQELAEAFRRSLTPDYD